MSLIDKISLSYSMEDFLGWSGKGDGIFSVRSCRHSLYGNSEGSFEWKKWAWDGLAPSRVQTFLWQICHKKLAVIVELKKRRISLTDVLCPLCHSQDESIAHLFLSCSVASELWCKFLRLWDISIVLSHDPSSILCLWSNLKHNSIIWRFIAAIIFCSDSDRSLVGDPTRADQFHISTSTKKAIGWSHPPSDMFKLNVDGAVTGDGMHGGIGGVLSDFQQLFSFFLFCSRACCNLPLFFTNLVEEIGALVTAKGVILRWIPRSCNVEADRFLCVR
ncbi:uncharacterized protein LOC120185787 [Hibiscus syriacus]|uniref:uncharacterized protein LOC120185787 n=1 Tax=Hibiscus syriacus TaxID=106335 RepID=UPI001924CA18|nr:uncharacterized protein LOC120185787 [Hibiscus syriacus]